MKKAISIISGITLVIGVLITVFFMEQKKEEQARKIEEKNYIKTIHEKNRPYVKTLHESALYQEEDGAYKQVGTVSKDVTLTLEPLSKVDQKTRYFALKNSPYFILIEDVVVAFQPDETKSFDHYIPFAEAIRSKDTISFFSGDSLVYKITEPLVLPIVIKEDADFYVVFDDQLLRVPRNSVEVVSIEESKEETAEKIATVAYHFFYQGEDPECRQEICLSIDQLNEQLSYLEKEGFYTMRMKDMQLFVEGKVQLPKKSVLITIDDGWKLEEALPIFNEKKMHATVFLMTKFYDPKNYASSFIEVHSHGDNLHYHSNCAGGQGGPIRCHPEEEILLDLKTSRDKLNQSTVFCYPFYEYNDYAIRLLKQAGFNMAFAGGNRKIKVGDDLMKLSRYTILATTTFSDFQKIVAS